MACRNFSQPLHPAVLDHLRLFLSAEPALRAEGQGDDPTDPVFIPGAPKASEPNFYAVLTQVLLGEEFR